MNSVELFAGCGGLAYGLSLAGFNHLAVVEKDEHAFATLELNRKRGTRFVTDWPLLNQDVQKIDWKALSDRIDVVSGGPPCQPFSIGGSHSGPADARNMWPEAIRAVAALRPKAFVFENVRGLLRPAFNSYVQYLKTALCWPDLAPKSDEDWTDHHARLLRHEGKTGDAKSTYSVQFQAINTADFGAAQKRHRALIIGMRRDIVPFWQFPAPTHSRAALEWSQDVDGEYWRRHNLTGLKTGGSSISRKAMLSINLPKNPAKLLGGLYGTSLATCLHQSPAINSSIGTSFALARDCTLVILAALGMNRRKQLRLAVMVRLGGRIYWCWITANSGTLQLEKWLAFKVYQMNMPSLERGNSLSSS